MIKMTFSLLVFGVFLVACHKPAPVQSKIDAVPVIKDTVNVVPVTKDTAHLVTGGDTAVVALFKDTAGVSIFSGEGRTFKLRTRAQRQSLHTILRKERELWRARKPRDYEFLLLVGCFCPGTRGWLLIEVRRAQPLRAWDRTGKSAALADWNTFTIDDLYNNLERGADSDGEVQIAFDQRWHFPKYVRTVTLPGPDTWSTIDVRGFRPILHRR
jgi:hypothetical protein